VELLHGGVRGAKLEKREQCSPKHAHKDKRSARCRPAAGGSTPTPTRVHGPAAYTSGVLRNVYVYTIVRIGTYVAYIIGDVRTCKYHLFDLAYTHTERSIHVRVVRALGRTCHTLER
jgi:D-serine deaminase-like pyridoxal phosphate-dependent protein